jgi:hypothetical protein
LAVSGALALAVGIPVAVKVWRTPVEQPRVDAGVPVAAQPDLDAGTAMAAVPDASAAVVAVVHDAGLDGPDAGQAVGPAKPIVLTPAVVQRVIAANKQKFTTCFRDHKADLPSSTGTIKVMFSIASSGKVASATTELEGTHVGRCVNEVVKAMRFPRHVDAEVRVPIALAYDVK